MHIGLTFHNCREDDDNLHSSGPGIEREVIYTLYQQFERSSDQWFTPRADNFVTLATSLSMATAQYVSPARLSSLSILGATVSLLLIHGIAPGRLDPSVLQYFIYGCDLESIHPAFLSEWHPEIHQTITKWLAMGPSGDVDPFQGHFATYHDIVVSPKLSLLSGDVLKLSVNT